MNDTIFADDANQNRVIAHNVSTNEIVNYNYNKRGDYA